MLSTTGMDPSARLENINPYTGVAHGRVDAGFEQGVGR